MPWSTGCARAATTEFGMGTCYLLSPRQQKTRHIAVTGFFNFKRGYVMVPTAVESHSANATLSLAGARLSWFV